MSSRPPRPIRGAQNHVTNAYADTEFALNEPEHLETVRSIPVNGRLEGYQQDLAKRAERAARKQAKKAQKQAQLAENALGAPVDLNLVRPQAAGHSQVGVSTPLVHGTLSLPCNIATRQPTTTPSANDENLRHHPSTSLSVASYNQPGSPDPFQTSSNLNQHPSFSDRITRHQQSVGPLNPLTNQYASWSNTQTPGPFSSLLAQHSNLNTPPIEFDQSYQGLSQAELNEMNIDPDADEDSGSGSGMSESESDLLDKEAINTNEEASANANASSGLQLIRRKVLLKPRKRKRTKRPLHQSVSEDSESSSEVNPRKRRNSRSIGTLTEDLQRIVPVAYDKLKTAITNLQPWPITEESAEALETEAEKMAGDAWDQACLKLDLSLDPNRSALNLIIERFSQFRGTLKNVAVQRVPSHYGFIDLSDLANPMPENINAVKEKNRALFASLKNRFYYKDPSDMNPTEKNGMYHNAIFQYLLNTHWFGQGVHRRSHDFKGQTQLPLVTFALILTAVSCAIDCWGKGKFDMVRFERNTYHEKYLQHLKKLTSWVKFTSTQPRDLARELREDLLRNARATLPMVTSQPTTLEEEDEASMLAEFAANQS